MGAQPVVVETLNKWQHGGMAVRRSPGRPVEVDPQSIVPVALELFARRGLDSVTMTEVAEAAGVSRRSLFRWFPSKASLIWGGTLEATERFDAAWESHAPGEGGDAAATLLARVRLAYQAAIVPLNETVEETRLRMILIDDNPSVLAWGHELRGHMAEKLTGHMCQSLGAHPGELRVAVLAAAIGGAAYAALVWWARNDSAESPAEVLDDALAELAGALRL